MKVLHICYTDFLGGAAIAAYKMHKGLKKMGIESNMLVYKKTKIEENIIQQNYVLEKICAYLGYKLKSTILFFFKKRVGNDFSILLFPDSILRKRIRNFDPDIIHIHYLGPGISTIREILSVNRKIVWSLHDSFFFTGGCHTPGDCIKYQTNCRACQYLCSSKEKDISYVIFSDKKKQLSKSDISFVAPSNWMKEQAQNASLIKGKKIVCIHNPIDINLFLPSDKNKAKHLFNLDPNRKLIVAGGSNFEIDKNKGIKYLLKALDSLEPTFANQLEVVLFGTKTIGEYKRGQIQIKYLGYISEVGTLVNLYSAADVFVLPSKQESFGQVAAEAMACNTPVIAFNTSGITDIVIHKTNGYLAIPYSEDDLANGIKWIFEDEDNYSKLVFNTRSHVIKNFSDDKITDKLICFYNEVLSNV